MGHPADHLDKAAALLGEARRAIDDGALETEGRCVYMAAYHSASAYIACRTGRLPRTHHGTHTEFARLTRDQPDRLGRFWALLSGSYDLKQTADYLVGPERPQVTRAQVDLALTQAVEFTAAIHTAIAAQRNE